MHVGQAEIDVGLVRRLVWGRFPGWVGLDVREVASGGTVNGVYRLGDELVVRLPLTESGVGDLEWDARWLAELAPGLPVAIPSVVARGEPGEGYPWDWAVYRWLPGTTPVEGRVGDLEGLARDLAGFVSALRKMPIDGAPTAHRGGPIAAMDGETRAAIDALRRTDEPVDADAAAQAWEEALAAPPWTGPSCWVHADLIPSNLLVTAGRLTGVIDFATAGAGDPACDLIPAWNLLTPEARRVFHDAVDVDDAAWARGRARALSMALIQLPYYRHTNPVISANARYVIQAVLSDPA